MTPTENQAAAANKPAAPMTQIPNIQLEDFERAVYGHDYERAVVLLKQALQRLKAGGEFIGYRMDGRMRTLMYTRLCAAIVAMLADPRMAVSQAGVDHLLAEHSIMDVLWRASAFECSDHLMPMLAKPPGANEPAAPTREAQFMGGMALIKFLTTYSLRSGFGVKLEETFRRNPQQIFSLWAGILSHTLQISAQAHERREEVVGMHRIFADVDLPQEILATLSDGYMYTSYSTRPDKHDAKGTIHRLCARLLAKHEVPLPDFSGPRPALKERPTVLVPVEWFTSLHAMYRCYATLVRQLRRDFRVVALARPMAIDDVGRAEFDQVYEIPTDGLTIKQLADTITTGIRPDIIWYPSLGMEMVWTVLASVRLAPIQVMSLGHPSSSRSPAMDYVLCDEGAIGPGAHFTETIVPYPAGSARFVMRSDAELPPVERAEVPETVHVAVPAMLCKLNAPFMAAMKEVAERSQQPLQFHFFPNVMGLQLHQAAREIREWLPTALTYERNSYNGYMAHLAKCHVHLSTFPFGGTNSNIDSMLLGIPMVSLWGDEPHSRFDGMMQRRAGLPEWTIAQTREEYIAAALRLIEDHAERNELSRYLRALDIDGIFYGQAPEADRWGFADAMWRIYRDHDLLKGAPCAA